MERVREIVGNLGKEAEPGEVQKITYQVIDELLGSPVDPDVGTNPLEIVTQANTGMTVEDADEAYEADTLSPPQGRGIDREAIEARKAEEEARLEQERLDRARRIGGGRGSSKGIN